ncbi:DUF6029 family protein [Luteibaculum oceani]|uniref:TonB-dependent receptor n=1 Tax=Luteibaculum oceani TaxID=1294296 RepID=A0A5C6VNG6_9FLAO|nr:DUF6029 family protein [Luteibaculum oceani]TXC85065.1 hypothetical protein FRX97_00130 [Luteibaculum oceani]
MKICKYAAPFILLFISFNLSAQVGGKFSGNFEFNGQYYVEDTLIDAIQPDEKMLSNAFLNLLYSNDKISAGIRYEAYQNPLLGFPTGYTGQGIPYRFVSYRDDNYSVTVGNFYEQFGSGLVLRAYNSPGLGYDNAFDGIRLTYKPHKAINIKALWGKQRIFFDNGPGIVRGLDTEVSLSDLLKPDGSYEHSVIVGGSVVSKYQEDNRPDLNLPENVAAFSGRVQYANTKGINVQAEYAYKANDPSFDNRYIYHNGKALLASASYSTKGFGLTYGIKAVDNMSFRSDRNAQSNNLFINYIPALNRQHTYNLAASFYPYAVQPNGEFGDQIELLYTFQRGTLLGGKYGTYLSVNYSRVKELEKVGIPDSLDEKLQGYERTVFKPGKREYFQDLNIELRKKLNKEWSFVYNYVNLFYNMSVVQGLEGSKDVRASIHIADVTYKLARKKALRLEMQHMATEQDQGDWASAILEYTISPHWFFSVFDQYNYGNPEEARRVHYFVGSIGYIKDAFRITANLGKQRAGIFCVGGVCRNVPASSGFSLTVSGTF